MGCSPPGSSVHGTSPGKNTGGGCLALLQGFCPTQGSNPGLPPCRQILYHLSCQEAQEYWSGYPIPSPGYLPNPGIGLGSLALLVDSLPAELPVVVLYFNSALPSGVIRPGVCNLLLEVKCGPLSTLQIIPHWNVAMSIHLCIIYAYYCATVAVWSSCDRLWTTCQPSYIYYLVFMEKVCQFME